MMEQIRRRIVHLMLIWGAAALGCGGRDMVIVPGTRIHHDDFEYTVMEVTRTDRIDDRRAAGVFYVVTFRVENRAKRVSHRWGADIAYIVDEHGRQFENAMPPGIVHATPAGAVETERLVFDLPADAREPYLKVRGSFLMGDLFDANQYQRQRVRLF